MLCLYSLRLKNTTFITFMIELLSQRRLNCASHVGDITNGSTKQPKADSINVNIKLFHGDKVDDVIQAHPTILHSVTRTNRVGFNDAPFQSRSDIFITLNKAVNTTAVLKSSVGPAYALV